MKKAALKTAALLLLAAAMAGLVPGAALAASDSVTIESQKNDAFDYLQYYSSGSWKDLNTPRHWVEATGEICYCIEHDAGNPHGDSYTAASPSSVFSGDVLQGLQTILMFGYPCNTPSGFTADQARQATANAIRFWLSENGEEGSYSFTNRKAHPTYIRAKSGYAHVLEWADELLQMARDGETLSHAISFSPSSRLLTRDGDAYTGSVEVRLTNINRGYALDTSGLPSGVTVGVYTGNGDETLTFSAPLGAAGQTFTVTASGRDTRSLENITAYVPSNGSLQKIFLCATTERVVASASVGVNTPAFGALKIGKTGDGGEPLAGAVFGIYSDPECASLLAEATTGPDGTATEEELPAGTLYVKELSTVPPYVVDGTVRDVTVEIDGTAVLELRNSSAKGVIRIGKTGEVLTGTAPEETDYGTKQTPVFSEAGLAGCGFEVSDVSGNIVAVLTTDADGIAETGLLPFGTYTVKETGAPAGYIPDLGTHSVMLAYKDQDTPVVRETVRISNERVPVSVKMKKTTERFDTETMTFLPCAGAGFVFGLFTAEDIGPVPKDVLIDVLVTGTDGTASAEGIPAGSYYLRELAAPDDTYGISGETFPLTADGVNTVYSDDPIVNDAFKGNIAVWKEDATEPGRMLPGAVYEIRDADGLLYDSMTTDRDGYALSKDLPAGKYYVQEAFPPAGYVLTDDVFEVRLRPEDKATLVFEKTNAPNRAVLKKTDVTDGKPVPGARIRILNGAGETVFDGVTGEDGTIVLDRLPAGTYTFAETQAPSGYALWTETCEFSVDVYGAVTGTTEIADEPTVLRIRKTDLFTGEAFGNVEFRLLDADGNPVRTRPAEAQDRQQEAKYRIPDAEGEESFRVDENGCAEIRYLPVGEYRLVEAVPSGYIGEDGTGFTLTERDCLSAPKTLDVENCPTGIRILKVDASDGRPLQGAGFRVKVKNGAGFGVLTFRRMEDGSFFCDPTGNVTDLTTDSGGRITLYGIPLGTVWFEEIVTPEGYFPISAQKLEVTGEMSAVRPYEMTIKNSKYVKLGMDSDWWEFPALCLGILTAMGGTVFLLLRKRKKRSV